MAEEDGLPGDGRHAGEHCPSQKAPLTLRIRRVGGVGYRRQRQWLNWIRCSSASGDLLPIDQHGTFPPLYRRFPPLWRWAVHGCSPLVADSPNALGTGRAHPHARPRCGPGCPRLVATDTEADAALVADLLVIRQAEAARLLDELEAAGF